MDQIDRPVVEGAQGILDINWMTERIAVGGWVETDEKMQAAAKCGITHIIDMTWECDDTPLAKPYGMRWRTTSSPSHPRFCKRELILRSPRWQNLTQNY